MPLDQKGLTTGKGLRLSRDLRTIDVNRTSIKQLLNNFLGRLLKKLKQFSGGGSKMDCL